MKNIFIKNLAFAATREDIKTLFEGYGVVAAVTLQTKKKGKSRGFGFVFMPDEAQADKAIAQLEGKEFMGRPLSVSRVVPKVAHKPKPGSKRHSRQEDRQAFRNDATEARPSKPWGKSDGGAKPFRKPEGSGKPWVKREGPPKLFRKDGAPFNASKPFKSTPDKPKVWDAKSNAAPKRPETKPKAWGRDAAEAKPFRKSAGHSKPWVAGISTAPKSFNKDTAPSKGTKTWDKKSNALPKPFGKDKAKAWGKSSGGPKPFTKSGGSKFTGNKTMSRNKGNAKPI